MKTRKKYGITEIFYSIQGEGSYAGTPMVFVRFAGCNLDCHFCDTDFKLNKRMTADEIFRTVKALAPKNHIVLFTGGEPSLQFDVELLQIFVENNYDIHMETNGTILLPYGIAHITVSPKETGKLIQSFGNDIKIVYDESIEDLDTLIKSYEELDFENYFVQPMSMENTEKVIDFVLKNPKWKISTQLQKIWNVE